MELYILHILFVILSFSCGYFLKKNFDQKIIDDRCKHISDNNENSFNEIKSLLNIRKFI